MKILTCLIWSIEHDGWWKPNWSGYTKDIDEAGRYSFDRAVDIVEAANKYCHDRPNEALVPYDFGK